jgi:hypothetical protein
LHAATGLLEVYAFRAGLSAAIWANVAVRVLAVALFASLGLRGGLVSLVTPPAFLAASALAYRWAGVGKATMYRRWDGKETLAAEAIHRLMSDAGRLRRHWQ